MLWRNRRNNRIYHASKVKSISDMGDALLYDPDQKQVIENTSKTPGRLRMEG